VGGQQFSVAPGSPQPQSQPQPQAPFDDETIRVATPFDNLPPTQQGVLCLRNQKTYDREWPVCGNCIKYGNNCKYPTIKLSQGSFDDLRRQYIWQLSKDLPSTRFDFAALFQQPPKSRGDYHLVRTSSNLRQHGTARTMTSNSHTSTNIWPRCKDLMCNVVRTRADGAIGAVGSSSQLQQTKEAGSVTPFKAPEPSVPNVPSKGKVKLHYENSSVRPMIYDEFLVRLRSFGVTFSEITDMFTAKGFSPRNSEAIPNASIEGRHRIGT
jgi:hypothetical protein